MKSKLEKTVTFRAPVQQRSRESLARIYGAINALLEEKNFDQVTMAELSKRAEVTIGSIYQRFGSKDELLWIMYGSYLTEASAKFEVLLESATTMDIEQRVEAQISLVFDLFRAHKGVIRSLLLKHRQEPDSVPEKFRNQIHGAFDAAARYLVGDGREEFDDQIVLYAISVIIATCRELLLFGEYQWASPKALEKPEFVTALKSAVLGVLNSNN